MESVFIFKYATEPKPLHACPVLGLITRLLLSKGPFLITLKALIRQLKSIDFCRAENHSYRAKMMSCNVSA